MEPQVSTNKWQIIAKFGLIFSFVLIALDLILYILGLKMKAGWFLQMVTLGSGATAMYFGIVSLRDNVLNGFITYGKGVSTGVTISLLASLILTLYNWFFNAIIDPEFMDQVLAEGKRRMIEQGYSEDMIEQNAQAMKYMKKTWVILLSSYIVYFMIGFVASLIVSIFTKKEDPDAAYNSLQN